MSAPMATCPRDGEPLVESFEVPQTEWLCMGCGARIDYFSPTPADVTPELQTRYAELHDRYLDGERP